MLGCAGGLLVVQRRRRDAGHTEDGCWVGRSVNWHVPRTYGDSDLIEHGRCVWVEWVQICEYSLQLLPGVTNRPALKVSFHGERDSKSFIYWRDLPSEQKERAWCTPRVGERACVASVRIHSSTLQTNSLKLVLNFNPFHIKALVKML